ncbi:DUF523 domain-containing protein [Patescibacteria group bacterium]|nr:DUF523 domain-containing protein [Patescibacteria group bacterium]MBU4000154.1 DUF523 domain-containing protein [Patescibacteria group bacterium]MBU4056978.1 DUF523 domain-containing protein [Patescibacteria group bacterium]MBU4368871.1 DUF523 domain-containing protein [Patescibacteria group bacterium]
MKLCSACLLGINCKDNGKNNRNEKIIELTRREILIPVCPEQLGGLPTPRKRARQRKGRIYKESGEDITRNFNRGAKEVLKIAELLGIKEAIFKQRSPSCGVGQIYDGNFSGTVIKGDGVTTALLKKNGIKVISEEEL